MPAFLVVLALVRQHRGGDFVPFDDDTLVFCSCMLVGGSGEALAMAADAVFGEGLYTLYIVYICSASHHSVTTVRVLRNR